MLQAVQDMEDASGALSRQVVDDVAHAGGRCGRRRRLGTRRTRVGCYQGGWCMTWHTRVGVVDVTGGSRRG